LGDKGIIIGYEHFKGKWIVQFDEEPKGEPYQNQYEDTGKWCADTDSLSCVKR